jgi:hypothetical protein
MKSVTDTLFSNIRWSLTSAAINMVSQAISNTIRNAKELDSALNDIRIVTGYSANQMAEFAEQANKAAKALNSTTKAYAQASLIYF